MILVDKALKQRADENKPVRVGIIGAGYIGRALTLHITQNIVGMEVVAVFNRTVERAKIAWEQSGITDAEYADSAAGIEKLYAAGKKVYTDNPMAVCEAGGIDCIVEATGEVEFGAEVSLKAIDYGKHLVLLNAELDAVLGPILKVKADRAGVCMTNSDGDQPGVVMNLFRWVETIGYKPLLAGNIKGMLDHYRNPTTQERFARENNQQTKMVTSFADGTKLAMEQAVIANATGFSVNVRGMHGPACKHVSEALELFTPDMFEQGGIVDYILGAEPGPGVFVIGYNENPILQQVAGVLKMGPGPYYCFYVPYHLVHLETPLSVARAVLFNDETIAPKAGPLAEVLTTAKVDLKAGQTLDGIGGYQSYGLLDNYSTSLKQNLLPMSLSENCILKRDIRKDEVISYDDVVMPSGRLMDELRKEQNTMFSNTN